MKYSVTVVVTVLVPLAQKERPTKNGCTRALPHLELFAIVETRVRAICPRDVDVSATVPLRIEIVDIFIVNRGLICLVETQSGALELCMR